MDIGDHGEAVNGRRKQAVKSKTAVSIAGGLCNYYMQLVNLICALVQWTGVTIVGTTIIT